MHRVPAPLSHQAPARHAASAPQRHAACQQHDACDYQQQWPPIMCELRWQHAPVLQQQHASHQNQDQRDKCAPARAASSHGLSPSLMASRAMSVALQHDQERRSVEESPVRAGTLRRSDPEGKVSCDERRAHGAKRAGRGRTAASAAHCTGECRRDVAATVRLAGSQRRDQAASACRTSLSLSTLDTVSRDRCGANMLMKAWA